MRQQITAGLGFSISGLPYWTMDIGGFSVPARFSAREPRPEDAEEWRELNTRWFQFGTFVPLLRVHGEAPKREMWEIGGESHPAYQAHLRFDRLRYRLLPYVYSLAGAVTHEAGTILRPLVMDFRGRRARPVDRRPVPVRPGVPGEPGDGVQGAQPSGLPARGRRLVRLLDRRRRSRRPAVDAAAPYDRMPLHVRAGSIVPFGPELQWTGEKPADPITLFVYAGTDGAFTLYEDDGLTYGYEKGAFARIPIRWDDATATLAIGKREGSFPGMLASRTFDVVLVTKEKPVGFSFEAKSDRTVRYDGAAVSVELRSLSR